MTVSTENIWNNFNKDLLRFIKKRVKDSDAANDLLQDIFVKIHLKLDTLSDKEKLASWVWQITRNSILDYYKKRKFSNAMPDDIEEIKEPIDYNEGFVQCLKPMVNQLPEVYREAIMQTELGNLSQKDLAANLGISYSGAKSRVQRGRQKLYELFTDCCKLTADKYGNILESERKMDCTKC